MHGLMMVELTTHPLLLERAIERILPERDDAGLLEESLGAQRKGEQRVCKEHRGI